MSSHPFAEVIDFQEGPGIMAVDFRDDGVPLIRLSGLSSTVSVVEGCNYLDPEMVQKKWQHFRLRRGDTLLSTSAALGRVAVVDAAGEGSIAYTGIIRMRPRNSLVDASFIPYLLLGSEFQQQAEAVGVGSVMRHFGPSHLRGMRLTLPSLAMQLKIAAILSAYDDLIENNNHRIRLLEEIAKRIYREWFVDFRYPGHQDVPRVDSELGPIPIGWGVSKVSNLVARIPSGTVHEGASLLFDGPVPVIDQSRDEIAGFHEGQPGVTASVDDPAIVFGDHTCKMEVMIEPFSVGPNVVVFRPSGSIPSLLLGRLLSRLVRTQEYKRHWTLLGSKVVVVPPSAIGEEFVAAVRDSHIFTRVLRDVNRRLRATRDLLLPRLLSGEIPVADPNIGTAGTAA